jgi:hypothetical protein
VQARRNSFMRTSVWSPVRRQSYLKLILSQICGELHDGVLVDELIVRSRVGDGGMAWSRNYGGRVTLRALRR